MFSSFFFCSRLWLCLLQEWAWARRHAHHVPVPYHQPVPNLHGSGTPGWQPDQAAGTGTITILQVCQQQPGLALLVDHVKQHAQMSMCCYAHCEDLVVQNNFTLHPNEKRKIHILALWNIRKYESVRCSLSSWEPGRLIEKYHWLSFYSLFFCIPSYISGANPSTEVVTFCLHQGCMLGMFLLPASTCLGQECQDLLSPCDGMHVCTD